MLRNMINGPVNKATWPAAINAIVLLINGRIPDVHQLNQEELGLLMIVIGCLVAYWIPNQPQSTETLAKA